MLSVVLENPLLLGIGIDEGTAVWVKPDDTFEVVGVSSVIVFDAGKASDVRTDDKGNFAVFGVQEHILLSGDRFDLNKRTLIK